MAHSLYEQKVLGVVPFASRPKRGGPRAFPVPPNHTRNTLLPLAGTYWFVLSSHTTTVTQDPIFHKAWTRWVNALMCNYTNNKNATGYQYGNYRTRSMKQAWLDFVLHHGSCHFSCVFIALFFPPVCSFKISQSSERKFAGYKTPFKSYTFATKFGVKCLTGFAC